MALSYVSVLTCGPDAIIGACPSTATEQLTTLSTAYIHLSETATIVLVAETTIWPTGSGLPTPVVTSARLTHTITTATWEKVPAASSSSNRPSSTMTIYDESWAQIMASGESDQGLSNGATAGITVGVFVAVVLLLTGLFLCVRRRRRRRQARRARLLAQEDAPDGQHKAEAPMYRDKSELPGSAVLPTFLLTAGGKPELDSGATRAELGAEVPPPEGYVAEIEGSEGYVAEMEGSEVDLAAAARTRRQAQEEEEEQDGLRVVKGGRVELEAVQV